MVRLFRRRLAVAVVCVGAACASVSGGRHRACLTRCSTAGSDPSRRTWALAEDLSHIEKLQRAYGYYVDTGMWEDVSELFTENAVANYPAGVFVGQTSIREHLYMNVGGGKVGDIGLGNGRLYDHMNIQPVVHNRCRRPHGQGSLACLPPCSAAPAAQPPGPRVCMRCNTPKKNGVWKISKLDYYSGFGAPYKSGWAAPAAASSAPPPRRELAPPGRR